MTTTKFRQGQHIRVRHPQGSVGVVDDVAGGIVYVTFHFGLDVFCNPITASAGCRPEELERISEKDFDAVAEKAAWSRPNPEPLATFGETCPGMATGSTHAFDPDERECVGCGRTASPDLAAWLWPEPKTKKRRAAKEGA